VLHKKSEDPSIRMERSESSLMRRRMDWLGRLRKLLMDRADLLLRRNKSYVSLESEMAGEIIGMIIEKFIIMKDVVSKC
jgi:hypothetical protein